MQRSFATRFFIGILAWSLIIAAFPAECEQTLHGSGAAQSATSSRRVAAPAPARHLPETSQIVRRMLHRGKASHEVWNVVHVAGRRPQPKGVGAHHDRPRPYIVRAAGEEEVQVTSRRRLLDGANSALKSISVGGCSVTNYNVDLTVGDQQVVVILDSGSGDLAVASTGCDKTCNQVPDLWNTDQSGSTGQQGSLSYGSAQIGGEVFTEPVTLPGQPAVTMDMLAITSQDGLLEPAPCLADADYSYDENGILGFGPDDSAQANSETIVGFLADQGVPKIFSTLLCQQGGLLWMGGYNPDAATSAPLYTPLDTSQGYYLFEIGAIGLGGQNLNLDANDVTWLADTGTNFLVVPQQVADNAASILNGPMEQLTGVSGFFYGNSMTCVSGFTREEVDNALPALEFAIPDVDGNVTVLSYPASVSYVEVQLFKNGSLLFCPNIRPGNAEENGGFNIYSNNLMNEFVVIWDQVNGQLGFADADTTLCNPANRGPAGAPAVGLAPSQAFVPEAAQAPQLGFGPNVAFAPAVTAPQHAFAPQPGVGVAPAGDRASAPFTSSGTSTPASSSSASSPTAASSPPTSSSSPAPTPSSALAVWRPSWIWFAGLTFASMFIAGC